MARDRGTPYAKAVADNAAMDLLRLNVPGHSADAGSAPELIEYFGEDTVRKDISPLLSGVDLGPDNPLSRATALAAEAWGARRTWFLTNGASQANRMGALVFGAFGGARQQVVVQRSAHSSFIDGIILAGLTPAFAQRSTSSNRLSSGSCSSTPMRHFTVAGTLTASRIAAMQSATSSGSRIRHAPKRPLCTRSEGQPTLRLISR